jgi:acetyltransferase-like isoleucine patch superfamily enzyme
MRKLFRKLLRHLALQRNVAAGLWLKFGRPTGEEYALYLKRHGRLYAMGEQCSVSRFAKITDPMFVRLGNNVRLARCTIFGHDGSINMLRNAYGVRVDRVGKVDIRDNVFVGEQAMLMPDVTIGPDAIVAAGSVVTRDVEPGTIVAGVPARVIGKVADYVERLEQQTALLPWAELIRQRDRDIDPAMEPELLRMRLAHFFGEGAASDEPSPAARAATQVEQATEDWSSVHPHPAGQRLSWVA